MKIPFKQIYFAGCSYTTGGGLEEAAKWYANQGINYKNSRDASYTKSVSNYFNLTSIDVSMSGTGVIKIIKDFYAYIDSHKTDDTLFIFQFNESPFRINEWSNDLQNNFNMYVVYENNKLVDGFLIDEWLCPNLHSINDLNKLELKKQSWIDGFYNPVYYEQDIKRQLIGFISYLTLHDFNFIFTCENIDKITLGNKLCKNQFMPFDYKSLFDFATETKQRLCDITNINDDHPSFEAHQLYANELIKYIIKKYA